MQPELNSKKLPVNRGFDVRELLEGGKKEKEKKIEYIFRCIIDTVYLDTEYFFLLWNFSSSGPQTFSSEILHSWIDQRNSR